MRTVRRVLVFPLMLFVIGMSPAFADDLSRPIAAGAGQQQHIVSPSEIAVTVAAHVASQDASRAAIHEALARPEVRQMAASMGVDLGRASSAVDTLTGVDLEQAANAARQVNHQLTGGASTIVISTTTIIIILLLVIILIIAVK